MHVHTVVQVHPAGHIRMPAEVHAVAAAHRAARESDAGPRGEVAGALDPPHTRDEATTIPV